MAAATKMNAPTIFTVHRRHLPTSRRPVSGTKRSARLLGKVRNASDIGLTLGGTGISRGRPAGYKMWLGP